MSAVRLGFIKLNVPAMVPAVLFWRDAFGFQVTMTFDEPDFLEHALTLPGQSAGPHIMLVEHRDERDVPVGAGHGPVGLFTDDIAGAWSRALASGAEPVTAPFTAGPAQVALVRSPEGHEIELVQLPA